MNVGVDLSASENNPTGICIIDDEVECWSVYEDEAILKKVDDANIIAVDAPLTETKKPFREAERELMKEHGPMLPLNTPGMDRLSRRALRLFGDSSNVIETYPRAVESSLGITREDVSHEFEDEHQYDAFLCALAAAAFEKDEFISYGAEDEKIMNPSSDHDEFMIPGLER